MTTSMSGLSSSNFSSIAVVCSCRVWEPHHSTFSTVLPESPEAAAASAASPVAAEAVSSPLAAVEDVPPQPASRPATIMVAAREAKILFFFMGTPP